MREIKLRAKPRDLAHEQFPEIYQKREKDFVYGTGVYQDTHNTWLILENQDKKTFSEMRAVIVDPETVGQYTGLNDAEEIEMYEGNKIAFAVFDYNGADTQYEGFIKFANGQWEIWKSWDDEYYGADGAFSLYWVCSQYDEVTVIGNIHDNADLVST